MERLTEEKMTRMKAIQDSLDTQLRDLVDWELECRCRQRAGSYFGPLLRRVRAFSAHELEDELEPELTADEFDDILQVDMLIRGNPRRRPEAPQVWLAVEVSVVVDRHDVERAQRRAATLRSAGFRAIPTVAGGQVTEGGEDVARDGNVLLLQDGRAQFWEEALTEALADLRQGEEETRGQGEVLFG